MRAGEYRHRLTLQAQTETSDGHDGYNESWATLRSRVPARVAPLTGRELEQARQVDPRAAHEVRLRYWAGSRTTRIPGTQFIWHDGALDRTLTPIEPFREIEPRQTLAVSCREAK